jgi:hypothetical protein
MAAEGTRARDGGAGLCQPCSFKWRIEARTISYTALELLGCTRAATLSSSGMLLLPLLLLPSLLLLLPVSASSRELATTACCAAVVPPPLSQGNRCGSRPRWYARARHFDQLPGTFSSMADSFRSSSQMRRAGMPEKEVGCCCGGGN